MSNASSVTPFSPSSSAASSSASLASDSDTPSTGLSSRAVTLVPVQFTPQGGVVLGQMAGLQQQFRDLKVAAAPSSSAALDVKSARTPGSDLLGQKGVQTEHPYLDGLLRAFRPSQVPIRPLQKFSGGTSISCIPTLKDALKELKRQARESGFSDEQIKPWLTSDNTLIRLIEKETWWLCEIPEGAGSDAVALHFVEIGCGLALVPAHLKSYRVCLEATSGPHSSASNLVNVPPEHRKEELFRAAVRKNPYAINHLQLNELTIDLYELVGEKLLSEKGDFDAFSRLYASKEMAEQPRFKAVLERLQKEAPVGFNQGAPIQGGGGGGGGGGRSSS